MARNPKLFALELDVPGAPATPHTFPGVTGQFVPGQPVPVGDDTDITLDQARALDEDPGVGLKLVERGPRQAKQDERAAEALDDAAREGSPEPTEEG